MGVKKYEEAKKLNRVSFRRLTGVYPETFAEMVLVLRERETSKKKSGRPMALCLEDQLSWTERHCFGENGTSRASPRLGENGTSRASPPPGPVRC